MTEREIDSVGAFVNEVIASATEDKKTFFLWYRGHANAQWELVPSVHRDYSSDQESIMLNEFRLKAATRHTGCPADSDFARWIALMRHYGLPTRLLDWSQSPLTALFFAVEPGAELGVDGAVWQLNPHRMNENTRGIPLIGLLPSGGFQDLLDPPFVGGKSPAESVAAVFAPEIDLRMTVQQSAFTIHGARTPLETNEHADVFLKKFRVPSSRKRKLFRELRAIGIRRSSLFPDLENLARDVAYSWRHARE